MPVSRWMPSASTFLVVCALGAAMAQDPHEEGESKEAESTGTKDEGEVDVDALMKSMDLGGETAVGEDYVAEKTYEGHLSQNAEAYKAGAPVVITHSGGTVTVRCQEQNGITARLGYTVWGTSEPNMERYGKGIGLAAYGASTSGSVKTKIPAKGSGVARSEIPLTVNLPPKANVTVIGGAGWVQVDGCEGTVKVTNSKDGVVIEGTHTSVNVASTGGDVKINLSNESALKGSNSISSKGAIALKLPSTYDGKFTAKGSMVRVFHTVSGTHTDQLVSGTVGSGTAASLSLTATGNVDVTAP